MAKVNYPVVLNFKFVRSTKNMVGYVQVDANGNPLAKKEPGCLVPSFWAMQEMFGGARPDHAYPQSLTVTVWDPDT